MKEKGFKAERNIGRLKGGPIAGCLTELRVPRDRVASDKFIDTAKMFQLSGVCLPDTILF